jgi:hypothetical protein
MPAILAISIVVLLAWIWEVYVKILRWLARKQLDRYWASHGTLERYNVHVHQRRR